MKYISILFCICYFMAKPFSFTKAYQMLKKYTYMNRKPIITYATNEVKNSVQREALDLLDCLTCPKDPDDPSYDIQKDLRRDQLLQSNDYSELKVELRMRGLSYSGDKLEMMVRLLLNIIDPSVRYDEISGIGPRLEYINEEDIKTNKVKIISESERLDRINQPWKGGDGPDSDDLQALRSKRKFVMTSSNPKNDPLDGSNPSPNNKNGFNFETRNQQYAFSSVSEPQKKIMDGLVRKEVEFNPLRIRRSEAVAKRQDNILPKSSKLRTTQPTPDGLPNINDQIIKRTIKSYVVGGKDVLRTWERKAGVIILLPDEEGWQSKTLRTFADEIAFQTQSIVILPDIYCSNSYNATDHLLKLKQSLLLNESISRYLVQNGDLYSTFKYPLHTAWRHSQDEATIFDDILSCLQYASLEYNTRSLAVAGVGYGAGRALHAICDLQDIISYISMKKIEDILEKSSESSSETFLNIPEVVEVIRSQRLIEPNNQSIVLQAPEEEEGSPGWLGNSAAGMMNTTMMNETATKLSAMKEFQQLQELLEEGSISSMDDILPSLIDVEDFQITASPLFTSTQHTSTSSNEQIEKDFQLIVEGTERVQQRQLIGSFPSIPLSDLAKLRIDSLVAFCPSYYDLQDIGQRLRVASYFVFDENPTDIDVKPLDLAASSPIVSSKLEGVDIPIHNVTEGNIFQSNRVNASVASALELIRLLDKRNEEIVDFSFRVYESRKELRTHPTDRNVPLSAKDVWSQLENQHQQIRFIHHPITEEDQKCSQDAVDIGCVWMDVFSNIRQSNQHTDETGMTKRSPYAFKYTTMDELMGSLRSSNVASYLHDDINEFRNNRLTYW